jgi:DNA-directed RNA polymerase
MAAGWLALTPNRKTTKRQVMTLPYGSTRFSCRDYTEVWMRERSRELGYMPWPKEASFKATQYMSDLIWDSIGETVVAAREAMDWLQSCAKVVAKEELPVYWTTPSGFPVMQRYQNFSSRRVKTKLGDAVVKLSLQQEEDSIDKRRMANAISPNFVHSLDATHLVMSTELAVHNGIGSFAMIHDSFGTHAADTAMLAACLREAFVDLYHEKDVLGDFRDQIMRQVDPSNQKQIKPVPAKGELDVSVVRQSDFFFA